MVEGETWAVTSNVEYNTLELPLYSVHGINHPQTLKMKAVLEGREVVAMVDSGASHNFVSKELVKELGLVVDEGVRFAVCLGDGGRIGCQGLCKNLNIDLGQCQMRIAGYIFELGGIDLILGVDWLRTLGDVLLNWEKMQMKFSWGGRTMELHGDPSLNQSIVSLKSIVKTTDVKFGGAVLVKWKSDADGQPSTVVPTPNGALHRLLDTYAVVFCEPQGLPPNRNQDHAIII
ncbi:uncharacterized protein [Henckelia pumila]|uniref:uncharacterized protein n=1 Tax=Henckelia pumila TaxID=405737 RepID=UPI003C6E910E